VFPLARLGFRGIFSQMHGDEKHQRQLTKKERHRFYLLPGMGGRASRRKRRVMLIWSIIAGILVSTLLAFGLYLLNKYHAHNPR